MTVTVVCLLQVIGCEDGFLNLMDESGACREDLKCPPKDTDVGKEVEQKLSADEPFMVSSRNKIEAREAATPPPPPPPPSAFTLIQYREDLEVLRSLDIAVT